MMNTYVGTNQFTTGNPAPTFESILAAMKEFEKIPKPEFTDLLFMRTLWLEFEKQLPVSEAPKSELTMMDRLYGFPVHVFDTFSELSSAYRELEKQGRRPKLVTDNALGFL
jgi:hypothetical protein